MFDKELAHPMDGSHTRVQGVSNLRISPVATVGTAIGFAQDPRME